MIPNYDSKYHDTALTDVVCAQVMISVKENASRIAQSTRKSPSDDTENILKK